MTPGPARRRRGAGRALVARRPVLPAALLALALPLPDSFARPPVAAAAPAPDPQGGRTHSAPELPDVRAEAQRIVATRRLRLRLTPVLDELFRDPELERVPGLALGVLAEGELLFAEARGVADLSTGAPATVETTFCLGPAGEALAAAAVCGLVEEGSVRWRMRPSEQIPGWQPAAHSGLDPTLVELFSHSSGFGPMEILWRNGRGTRGEVFRAAASAVPSAEPGERYQPFRVGPTVAVLAASQAAGEGWWQSIGRRLLDPCRLRSTYLGSRGPGWVSPAQRYRWDPVGGEHVALPPVDETLAPTLGMHSNVPDLARWMELLLGDGSFEGERVLRPGSMRMLQLRRVRDGRQGFALGLRVGHWRRRALLEHGGAVDGATALVVLFPEEERGWVLLANARADALVAAARERVSEAVLGLLDDEPAEVDGDGAADPPATAAPRVQSTPRFLGGAGRVVPGPVHLVATDSAVALVPGSGRPIALEPPGPNGYLPFASTMEGAAELLYDDEGSIRALRLHLGGMTFDSPMVGTPEAEAELPGEWERYLGHYAEAEGDQAVDVYARFGRLAFTGPEDLPFDLEPPDAEGRWALGGNPRLAVSFQEDAEGEVVSMTQHRPNSDTVLLRVGGLPEDAPAPASPAAQGGAGSPAPDAPAPPDPAELLALLDSVRGAERRSALLEGADGLRLLGSVEVPGAGVAGSAEARLDGAERYRLELDLAPYGELVLALDGGEAWLDPWFGSAGPWDADQARVRHPALLFADWHAFAEEVRLVPRAPGGDGEAAARVELVAGERVLAELEVLATGDVARARYAGGAPSGVRCEGFRTLSGIPVPFRWTLEDPELGEVVVRWRDLEVGVDFGADAFGLPLRGGTAAGPAPGTEAEADG